MSIKYHKLFLISLLLFIFLPTNAQRNTDKALKQAEKASNTVEKLGSIFQKKNKDTATRKNTNANIKAADSIGAQGSPTMNFAGKLTPDVKYIDCDRMFPFDLGAALITKGNAFALIDASGNFLIPFHKYENILRMSDEDGYTGFFRVLDAKNNFFINSKGKIVFDTKDKGDYSYRMSNDSKHIVLFKENKQQASSSLIIIDYLGNRVSLTIPGIIKKDGNMPFLLVKDSVIIYSVEVGDKTLYGFKNIWNKGIPPTYDKIEGFNNGVAIFTTIDEFGKSKYGIIDRDGKIIVPAQFTIKPANFKYGITSVRTNAGADFLMAFIDTKGNILFKQTKETQKTYGFFGDFILDYSKSANGYLLHKSGRITNARNFFTEMGFDGDNYKSPVLIPELYDYKDGLLRFEFRNNSLLRKYYGTYDVRTNSIVHYKTPELQNIKDNQFYLDPVSKLTYVSIEVDEKDRNGRPLTKVGYVNTKGEFVMVRGGEKTEW